jgi:hypothetical protein
MNKRKLNKIKINTLTLNRIGEGVVSASASGGGTDEVPDGYQMLIDKEDAYLIDSNDKIIVVPVEDEGGENNIIKFTLNGEEYTAEEGMTWYDWCQSAYNKDGWTCDSPSDLVYTWKDYFNQWNYEYFFVVYNGTSVLGSDAIIPNGNYEDYEDSMHIGGGV